MQRITNLKNILVTIESFSNSYTNFQVLRWRRKPRWLPVAKSKMFRVPARPETPPEEKAELMRLYNNYRTYMKAIRSYLHSQYNVASVVIDTEVHEKEFLEEFNACCKINDEWNKKIKIVRDERHVKDMDAAKDEAFRRIDERNEIKRKMLENVEEIVRKEKEASKTFITPDNIDAAIEHALANPVDYNYSIDLEGNLYHGRETKPEVLKKEKIAA